MEFNALIFCGKGSSLSPFSSVKDTGTSKALLPVANRPMIEYVLEWCDQAPFKTVTVVCGTDALADIGKVVETYKEKRGEELNSTSTLSCLCSGGATTGSVLNEIMKTQKFLYKRNLVILPCDFITDVPPQVFIEIYRENSDENLGLAVSYKNLFENIDSKVLKTNYTVYAKDENGNGVLLDMYSKPFVAMTKFLKIRTQMLWRYPETKVSMKLLDSFIFFVNSKLFDIVESKGEQFITGRSANKIKRDIARRSWSHSLKKGNFYMEANRYILKQHARITNIAGANAAAQKSKEGGKNSANVGADCIVGQSTELGVRTSVKRSVIGNDCKIGKNCRISACIVLDHAEIGDDVHLENCIIGKKAKLESRCKLVNCNVEGCYIVGKGVSLKGETLTNISLDEFDNGEKEIGAIDSEGGESGSEDDEALYSESVGLDAEDDEGEDGEEGEESLADSASFDSEFVFAD
ncbi:hypothetical protein HII12_004158 [Brettanomyces bruxellensis]|uniref:Translation initiation factor eIF2B subunit gamma n=1 Tax=Dekkera bruxellensis TaxID=5007 RepID=A0A8H6ES80_DEKBR|nr:hypothetical protein HII12_004158 [Brettanomyces bruxellensis]